MSEDCGCEATLLYASGGHSEAGATELRYCARHDAAPELLAAARALVYVIGYSEVSERESLRLRDAIAAAERKQP